MVAKLIAATTQMVVELLSTFRIVPTLEEALAALQHSRTARTLAYSSAVLK